MAWVKAKKVARRADKTKADYRKACPFCEVPMVATRVLKGGPLPQGMYWVCPKCDGHMRTKNSGGV